MLWTRNAPASKPFCARSSLNRMDLYHLHQVSLGEKRAYPVAKQTLLLLDAIHSIWAGEDRLVSIPIIGKMDSYTVDECSKLMGRLCSLCADLGIPYNRTQVGEVLVEGVAVRVYIIKRDWYMDGVGNCSVADGDRSPLPCAYPIDDSSILCPITLAPIF